MEKVKENARRAADLRGCACLPGSTLAVQIWSFGVRVAPEQLGAAFKPWACGGACGQRPGAGCVPGGGWSGVIGEVAGMDERPVGAPVGVGPPQHHCALWVDFVELR